MNIQTVAENLRNTIAGKEKYLAEIKTTLGAWGRDPYYTAIKEMLEINIAELKRILADVESCVARDVEQSWRDNPDRMGGQFTQDEIYDMNRTGWIEP